MYEVSNGGSRIDLHGHDLSRKMVGCDNLSNDFTVTIYIVYFAIFLYLCITHGLNLKERHLKQSLKFFLERQQYRGSYHHSWKN